MPDSASRSRVLICVGGGALIAALALAAIVLRSPALAHGPTGNRDFLIAQYPVPSYSIPVLHVRARAHQGRSAISGAVAEIGFILALAVLLAIVAAIAMGLSAWWQRRPRRQHLSTAADDPLPTMQEGIAQAQQRLRFGTPDDSIVECWAALEDAAARSGISPDPADTPSEFVIRLLDSLDADSEALQWLSQLYHQARFGSLPSTDIDRESARASLERIATSLQAPVRVP